MKPTFYEFEAESLQGKSVKMEDYADKTVLVVNTASKCGLTPQLEGLQNLYEKYQNKGLVVLGFPCNQFMGQEPGGKESIEETCMVNYGVTFPMFSKIKVNGNGAHPLYKYLKSELKGKSILGSRIKWNFTKFLIDAEGNPVKRFEPKQTPEQIDNYLQDTL